MGTGQNGLVSTDASHVTQGGGGGGSGSNMVAVAWQVQGRVNRWYRIKWWCHHSALHGELNGWCRIDDAELL